MKRMCAAFPTSFSPSKASILKESFLPFISVRVAVAWMVLPIAEGAKCEVSIKPPTVVEPSGSSEATVCIAAFSIKATRAGVAKTGRSPEPSARAVFCSVTVTVLVCCIPSVSIMFKCVRLIIIGFQWEELVIFLNGNCKGAVISNRGVCQAYTGLTLSAFPISVLVCSRQCSSVSPCLTGTSSLGLRIMVPPNHIRKALSL